MSDVPLLHDWKRVSEGMLACSVCGSGYVVSKEPCPGKPGPAAPPRPPQDAIEAAVEVLRDANAAELRLHQMNALQRDCCSSTALVSKAAWEKLAADSLARADRLAAVIAWLEGG